VIDYEERPGLAVLFAREARAALGNGSPLYADLSRAASLDLAAASTLSDLLQPWVDVRFGDMLPLRVLGAAHRLVLERAAPALALWFPSVGGDAPRDAAGRAACYAAWVAALEQHRERLPDLLASPPQTNDPARSAALVGVLHLVAAAWSMPLRVHELGASAGLNLLADQVRVTWLGGSIGPSASPLVLDDAWHGAPLPEPVDVDVVERVGCDLDPVDATTTEGRLRLTSYTWADQTARFERLRAAFELAAAVPVDLVRADLVDHLEALRPRAGTALVVTHSSTWQYLDADERARAERAFVDLGSRATPESPVVHAAREHTGSDSDYLCPLVLRWWPAPPGAPWPAGTPLRYADTPAHGVPVTWSAPQPMAPGSPRGG
jgi:hypothetical protein